MNETASGMERMAMGNIFDDSTASWNTSRPGKRNRESA